MRYLDLRGKNRDDLENATKKEEEVIANQLIFLPQKGPSVAGNLLSDSSLHFFSICSLRSK